MLHDKLKNYINFSVGSPRRQQFFKDLDLDFEKWLKEIEEVYPIELKEEITNYLAELKSNAFEGNLADNEILISDTIVWHNEKLGCQKTKMMLFYFEIAIKFNTWSNYLFALKWKKEVIFDLRYRDEAHNILYWQIQPLMLQNTKEYRFYRC
jgi:hypothetical protein